jgi:excisionase family DNA binding protein
MHRPQERIAYSIKEIAEMLGIHKLTAWKMVRTGRLRGTKTGSSWRVARKDIENLLGVGTTDELRPE